MPNPTPIPHPPSPSLKTAAILAAACEIHEAIIRIALATDPVVEDISWPVVLTYLWAWVKKKTGTTHERAHDLRVVASARAKTPPPQDRDLRILAALATILR